MGGGVSGVHLALVRIRRHAVVNDRLGVVFSDYALAATLHLTRQIRWNRSAAVTLHYNIALNSTQAARRDEIFHAVQVHD